MANSSEILEELKHSKWRYLLEPLVRGEHQRAKNEPINLGVLEKSHEWIDFREESIVGHLQSQCEGEHSYMLATSLREECDGLKMGAEFRLYRSKLTVPDITAEQRAYLRNLCKEKQPHLYIFTHAYGGEGRFLLGEMIGLVSRAVSTKRDIYFVLIRKNDAIAMKYDFFYKEFFEVSVMT